jgi:hypothetical protein
MHLWQGRAVGRYRTLAWAPEVIHPETAPDLLEICS